jgi:hypothetical protein
MKMEKSSVCVDHKNATTTSNLHILLRHTAYEHTLLGHMCRAEGLHGAPAVLEVDKVPTIYQDFLAKTITFAHPCETEFDQLI